MFGENFGGFGLNICFVVLLAISEYIWREGPEQHSIGQEISLYKNSKSIRIEFLDQSNQRNRVMKERALARTPYYQEWSFWLLHKIQTKKEKAVSFSKNTFSTKTGSIDDCKDTNPKIKLHNPTIFIFLIISIIFSNFCESSFFSFFRKKGDQGIRDNNKLMAIGWDQERLHRMIAWMIKYKIGYKRKLFFRKSEGFGFLNNFNKRSL